MLEVALGKAQVGTVCLEGGSGKVKKERARERWRGLEEGGVWSPSGQSPYGMEADPTALPRLAEAWVRVWR